MSLLEYEYPKKQKNIQQVPSTDDPFLTPTKTPIKRNLLLSFIIELLESYVAQVLEKTNIDKVKLPLIAQFLEEIGATSEEYLSIMQPKTLLDAAKEFKQKHQAFDLSLAQCSMIIHCSKPVPQPEVPQLIFNIPLRKELRDIVISAAQSINNNSTGLFFSDCSYIHRFSYSQYIC
jgi:hypothetical protein